MCTSQFENVVAHSALSVRRRPDVHTRRLATGQELEVGDPQLTIRNRNEVLTCPAQSGRVNGGAGEGRVRVKRRDGSEALGFCLSLSLTPTLSRCENRRPTEVQTTQD